MTYEDVLIQSVFPTVVFCILGYILGRASAYRRIAKYVRSTERQSMQELYEAKKNKCNVVEESYWRGRWDMAAHLYMHIAAEAVRHNDDDPQAPKTYEEEIGNDEEAVQEMSVEDLN